MKDGISIEATFPLDWEAGSGHSAIAPEIRGHGNIALLQALAAIDSLAHDFEHDVPEIVRKSIDRLETKLDVLLMLVADLSRKSTSVPAERPVILSADCISWIENSLLLQVGQSILIRLFLSPRIPQPLFLQATVREVTPLPDSVQVTASLDEADEEMSEWLTRTIFRYHRRALHARRQP